MTIWQSTLRVYIIRPIMFYGFAQMREIRARRAMLAEVSVKCGSLPPDAGELRALLT